ncbi:hypothetical protein PFISCL1PPCAC_964, partial [Pristionchus fissidentatus]
TGYIDPKSSITIRVIQHSLDKPAANKHFICIQHMKCTAADQKKLFRMVWRVDSQPDGVLRLPVQFTEAGNAPTVSATAPTPPKAAPATA